MTSHGGNNFAQLWSTMYLCLIVFKSGLCLYQEDFKSYLIYIYSVVYEKLKPAIGVMFQSIRNIWTILGEGHARSSWAKIYYRKKFSNYL